MGNNVVLFALEVEAGNIEAPEKNLEGLGDIANGDPEGGGTITIDLKVELRFFVVKIGTGLAEEACLINFVSQFPRAFF